AQEDAEMLRSLVVPLEEEIGALKDKLRSTDEQLHVYEAAFSGLVRGLGSGSLGDAIRGKSPAEVLGHLDDKMGLFVRGSGEERGRRAALSDFSKCPCALCVQLTSLCQGLQAEKASRSDLEMYVAVLNTQKTVIQEDMDRLRKELGEVCELLEREKREHGALKRTWQMANDRFLEAQQAHVRDLARLQTVLTGDQQRHLSQLRRSEAPHAGAAGTLTTREGAPAAGSEGRPPQASRESHSSEQQHASPLRSGSPLPGNRFGALEPPQFARAGGRLGRADDDRMHSSPANLNVSKPPAAALLGPQEQGHHRRSLSSSDLPLRPEGVGPALGPRGCADDTQSLGGDCASVPNTSVSLTRDQLSALSDATPDMEARKSLLEMARMEYDDVLSVGKRVVSDKEWLRLEDELQHLRERLCQPCEMCSNYEVRLQQVQCDLERHMKELAVTRQDLSHERSFRQGLEQRYADSATDVRHQVCELQERLQAAESSLEEARQAQLACVSDTRYHVSQLKEHLTQLRDKAQRVEQDNHQLLGRYVVRARALQDQPINLPDSMEDLRFQYLQLQEDLIKVQLGQGEAGGDPPQRNPLPARPGRRRAALQAPARGRPQPRRCTASGGSSVESGGMCTALTGTGPGTLVSTNLDGDVSMMTVRCNVVARHCSFVRCRGGAVQTPFSSSLGGLSHILHLPVFAASVLSRLTKLSFSSRRKRTAVHACMSHGRTPLSQVKEQLEQERRCRLEKEKEKGRCELRLAQVVGEADERLHALQKAHDGLASAKVRRGRSGASPLRRAVRGEERGRCRLALPSFSAVGRATSVASRQSTDLRVPSWRVRISAEVPAIRRRLRERCREPVLQDKLEAEVLQLRGRVQTLQTELDNSEAVQRDFVKLSQSLQSKQDVVDGFEKSFLCKRKCTRMLAEAALDSQSFNDPYRSVCKLVGEATNDNFDLFTLVDADVPVVAPATDAEVHEDDVGECNTCKRGLHARKEK
ncbi:hypothetical protein HPB47_014472, partial [Ixodes persulcatus]